jgi:hypothetical protein
MSRSAANLPPVPAIIGHRSMATWAGIRVHHTGGAFSSWRAVHDWQTAGRPPDERLAYIGYSFGISDGRVWTLRGWDRQPAHDFINTHLGVVFGGVFEDRLPAGADLDALVWFIRRAERRAGRPLPLSTHREIGGTTCPGSALHQWIKQVLPGRLAQEESDVSADELWRHEIRNVRDDEPKQARGMLRYTNHYAYQASQRARQLLAGQAAILAQLLGDDVRAAVRTELERAARLERTERRAELAELAGTLGPALTEALQDAVADLDLPAELIETAAVGTVDRVLARLRLVVEPEPEPEPEPTG